MSLLSRVREKAGGAKLSQWAALLLTLGLAGSLLFSQGGTFDFTAQPQAQSSAQDGSLEARLSAVLSRMEGAGQVEVVIHYAQAASSSWPQDGAQAGEPIGVVVVAEGAGDLRVRLELAQAVQTLLRLDADAVEVFAMEWEDKTQSEPTKEV